MNLYRVSDGHVTAHIFANNGEDAVTRGLQIEDYFNADNCMEARPLRALETMSFDTGRGVFEHPAWVWCAFFEGVSLPHLFSTSEY
jgi:hypothetical protein